MFLFFIHLRCDVHSRAVIVLNRCWGGLLGSVKVQRGAGNPPQGHGHPGSCGAGPGQHPEGVQHCGPPLHRPTHRPVEPQHTHAAAIHTPGSLHHGLQVIRLMHSLTYWIVWEYYIIFYIISNCIILLGSFQEPLEEEEEKEESDDDEEEEEKASNLPMMVPMADMLNHVSNHNAHLEYTPVRRRPPHLRSTRQESTAMSPRDVCRIGYIWCFYSTFKIRFPCSCVYTPDTFPFISTHSKSVFLPFL